MATSVKTIFEVAEERAEQRGRKEERQESVIKLWQKGIEPPMISNLLDIPIEQVEHIITEFQKQENHSKK